jgi:hypothetical protein
MIKLAAAAVGLSVIAAGLATAFTSWPKPDPKVAPDEPVAVKTARIIPIYRKIEERAPTDPVVVAVTEAAKTPIAPKVEPPLLPKPEPEPELQLPTRRHYGHRELTEVDRCAKHGLHRVETHNGKSWRCR